MVKYLCTAAVLCAGQSYRPCGKEFIFSLSGLLSLIRFSHVSLCRRTKTNIHCNIYEHSPIVTMVSKKTGKMDRRVDALPIGQS